MCSLYAGIWKSPTRIVGLFLNCPEVSIFNQARGDSLSLTAHPKDLQDQKSLNEKGETVTVSGKGRHAPCVVPQAVLIVEAMVALVLADFYLRHKAAWL